MLLKCHRVETIPKITVNMQILKLILQANSVHYKFLGIINEFYLRENPNKP